jgi:hypothetical protein
MWFGNRGAVIAYDGARWQRIEVPTSYVRVLAFDPGGALYVGGTDELGYFAPDTNGLPRYVSLLDRVPEALRKFGVLWTWPSRRTPFSRSESHVLRWRDGAFKTWSFVNKPRQALKYLGGTLICIVRASAFSASSTRSFSS